MPIDREKLLKALLLWLPRANKLTQEEIEAIMELQISIIGDDEVNFGEIFCKTLKLLALKNADILTNTDGLKRMRVGGGEVEFGSDINALRDFWDEFIKNNLNEICPLYGYRLPVGVHAKIYKREVPTKKPSGFKTRYPSKRRFPK